MNLKTDLKRFHAHLSIIFGALGMIMCIVSLALSMNNSEHSMYCLTTALILLGINRICLHVSNHQENFLYTFVVTGLMFVLGILVALTSINIYFLTVSFFAYGVLISLNHVYLMKKDHSIASIVLNSLIITFCFTYSFIFLFPAIYEKHATSVTNWNFIVLSYSLIAFFTCFKNALIPVSKQLKIDQFVLKVRQEMALTILMGLLVLVTLCSIYFTLVEPQMTSFVDSLWYSFSVITTIGFGDVSVLTTFGRILSVILGIYGLVVVALITSIIVTIYNDKKDSKSKKSEEVSKEEEK